MYIIKLSHKGDDGVYHEGSFFSGFGMAYRSEYEIFEPVLETKVNSIGHLSFTIYPTHPLYEFANQPKAVIEVVRYGISEPLFVGRLAECVTGLYNEKRLTFESELSYLLDSIRTNFNSVAGYGCEYWLNEILEYHNSHADNFGSVYTENIQRKFNCGKVSESIKVRCINIPAETFKGSFSTLDIIRKLLLEKYGGVLKIRHEGGVNYIDWLDENDLHVCSQKIELTSNLLNIENSVTTDRIVTALRPTGENVSKNGESVPLDISLTDVSGYISDDDIFQMTDNSVSASSKLHFTDTIYSQSLVNKYGWICREVCFSGVKSVADLTKKAVNYLSSAGQKQSILLNAADLSKNGNSIENFLAGDRVIVNSPVHSFFESKMMITSVTMNLSDLTAGEIVIGNESESISSQMGTGSTGGSMTGAFSGGGQDYSESIKAAFDDAVSYTDNALKSKVDKEEGKSLSTNDFTDAYKSQVDTNKSDISALKSKTDATNTNLSNLSKEVESKANSVDVYTKSETDSKITSKVSEIVAGAPEDFDTLKEMSDWLLNHENSAAAMNTAITQNAEDIKSLEGDISVQKATNAEHLARITDNANNITGLDVRLTQTEDKVTNNTLKIADNTAEIEQIRTNVTATGTAVVLDDLQGGVPFSEIEVQDINLLYNILSSRTYKGITYTKNDDGSISFSGTATEVVWFVLTNKTITLNKGSYVLGFDGTFFTEGITSSYYYMIRHYSTGDEWVVLNRTLSKNFISTNVKEDNTPISVGIRVETGDTVDCTIYPYLNRVESGLTEYVSPIIGKENELTVCGKNLIKLTDNVKTVSGVTFTTYSNGCVTASGTNTGSNRLWFYFSNRANDEAIRIKKGLYTISGVRKFENSTSDNTYFFTVGTRPDGRDLWLNLRNSPSKTGTFNNCSLSLGLTVDIGDSIDAIYYPQLEIGDTATEFEPYHGYTKTFTPTESPFVLTENLEQYDGTNTLMVSAGELSVTGVKKNSALKNVWEEFGENQRQATALDIRLTQTENKVTNNIQNISNNAKNIENLQTDTEANTKGITALDIRLTQTETKVTNNIQSISNIKKDIEDNYYNKTEINTKINEVNTNTNQKFATLEAQFNGISGAVTQNAEDIEALENVQKVTNTDIYARIRENASNIAINKTTLGYQKKNLFDWNVADRVQNFYTTVINETSNAISISGKTKWSRIVYKLPTIEIGKSYILSVRISELNESGGDSAKILLAFDTSGNNIINASNLEKDGVYELEFNVQENANSLYLLLSPNWSGTTYTDLSNSFTVSEVMLRYANVTDDTYEPYVKSVKERFESQTLVYSNTTGGSSPLTLTVSNLFADYSAVICNITTSSGNYSIVLPLGYMKSLGTSTYYEAEGLLFYYVDDGTITIRTGLAQSNPTISNVKIIGLY